MKVKITYIFSTIAFLMVLVILFSVVSFVICEKPLSFYSKDEGTMDVVVVGNSISYCSVNPAVMWQEEGIAAYNLGIPLTGIGTLYYYMVDFFKTQSPKVVVLEAYVMGIPQPQKNAILMPFSQNKIDATQYAYEENWTEYIFPLFRQHGTYEDINEASFEHDEDPLNGYRFISVAETPVEPLDYREYTTTPEESAISQESLYYFDLLLSLCKENDAELMVTHQPTLLLNRTYSDAVAELCAQNDIKFIEYVDVEDEIGFSLQTDMMDGAHMNYLGAEKISKHLGEVLATEYSVENRKGQPEYQAHEQNSQVYYRMKADEELRTESTLSGYLQKINDEHYTSVIGAIVLDTTSITPDVQVALSELGFAGILMERTYYSYMAVKDGATLIHENLVPDSQSYLGEANGMRVEINCNYLANTVNIQMDNANYQMPFGQGMQIVVYDKILKKVVDVANFESTDIQTRVR